MTKVTIRHAKMHLSDLLKMVERGDNVVIARAGKPIAILSAFKAPRRKIAPPGSLEGQGWMADDFNEPMDEMFDSLARER